MGPLRFGLHSGQHRTSFPELRDLWRAAAVAGFDACYLFDHFRPLFSDVPGFLPEEAEAPDGPCLEAFSMLGALAREVPDVNVGIMVASAGYRAPALAGHMTATLQQAAAGRLEIGFGTGWLEPEYRQYGYEFAPARERLALLEGLLEACAAWWAGEPAAVASLGIDDMPLAPVHPMPRLWIAGTGERHVLRLAARYADSWNAMFLTPAEFAHKVEVLAEHCDRIGRPLAKIERSIALRAFCSPDGTRALARMRGLAALRDRDPDEVAARSLAGTPIDCAEQVAAYADAGANHVTIMVHPPYDLAELELLGAEVFSRFR